MQQEKIEEKIVELALELYKDEKGEAEYKKLIQLFDANFTEADNILFDFINKNKEYLKRETQLDLQTSSTNE
jgi:hypothetical protein